jgi:alpha-L-fucosidase
MRYQATLESVKSHPLPDWYQDAKLGIFVHWGVYSVPAFAPVKNKGNSHEEASLSENKGWGQSLYAEWYQNSLRIDGSPTQEYHRKKYGEGFRYEQFGELFNKEIQKWNPDAMAELFAQAGARYVVLVSKHHDGFLMWKSGISNPRITNWQVSRDVAGELSQAVNARGMKMGLYYSSLLDWSFTKKPINSIEELVAASDISEEYVAYVEKHWLELIERYDPWILWSDIGYPPGYQLPKLWAHYYNHKPEGVINDRWIQMPKGAFSRFGRFLIRKYIEIAKPTAIPEPAHKDFVTPEYATLDHITAHKWETCRGIGNSFGFNQFEDASHYESADALIRLLADVVSKNGNLLLNVGPRADGSLHPLQVEALEGLGAWLKVNGEAIYGTKPWKRFTDPNADGAETRYTSRDGALYVIVIKKPENGVLCLPVEMIDAQVNLLETGEALRMERSTEGQPMVKIADEWQGSTIPVIKIHIT